MFTCVKAFIKGTNLSSIMTLGHQQIATKNFDSYSLKHFFPSSMPFLVHELICVSYFSPSSISHLPFLFQLQIVSHDQQSIFQGVKYVQIYMYSSFPRLPSSLLLFLLSICLLEFTTISFWIGLIMKFNSIWRWYKSSHKKKHETFFECPISLSSN